MIFESNSASNTYEIGKAFGQKVKPKTLVSLDGDLGTGKTVWAKGFAEGLGVKEPVTSPTFTIMHMYESGRLPLYHFDVYRLGDVSELDDIGFDEYAAGDGVCLVEWGQMFPEAMEGAIRVKITKDLSKGLDYRRIEIEDDL